MAEVVNCTTARDAWLSLETSFSRSSKTRELQLKDELQLKQRRGSRGVAEYARSFRSFCDQLKIFSTFLLSRLPLPSFTN
jgi:hypothetical protein